jgi:hypothetical protein
MGAIRGESKAGFYADIWIGGSTSGGSGQT